MGWVDLYQSYRTMSSMNLPIVNFNAPPTHTTTEAALGELRDCKRSRFQSGNNEDVERAAATMETLIGSKDNEIEHLRALVAMLLSAKAIVSADGSAKKGTMTPGEQKLLDDTHVAALARDLLAVMSKKAELEEVTKAQCNEIANLNTKVGILENKVATQEVVIQKQDKRISMIQNAAIDNV